MRKQRMAPVSLRSRKFDAIMRLAGHAAAAVRTERGRERKVRASQGRMPDNVRQG